MREPPCPHFKKMFPTLGCRVAYQCGSEFILAGGKPDDVFEALSFTDTAQEEKFFMMGLEQELADDYTTPWRI